MDLTGEAHGKLLLFGDHAVVYGHPALGLTLPLTTRVTLTTSGTRNDDQETIASLVSRFSNDMQQRWHEQPWRTSITSDVPIGQGYGSSAALTGALARALLPADATPQALWQEAHQAEHAYHGRPSGVDTALALGTGLLSYVRPVNETPHIEPVEAEPFSLVTGALPRGKNTRALIADVHARVKSDSHSAARLQSLADLAAKAIDGLSHERQTAAFLGKLATQAQRHLAALGLSTPAMDQVLSTAQNHGATGSKLSGAGDGGAFVAFCSDEATALKMQTAIAKECQRIPPASLMAYRWDGSSLTGCHA